MKRRLIALAIVVGIVGVGGILVPLPIGRTVVTAHAAESAVVDSGTIGTCPWQLTADGVLHVESGTLPESTPDGKFATSPFVPIQIREGGDENNLNLATISFDGTIKTPVNAAFLFANLLNNNNRRQPQIRNWQNLDTSHSTNFAFMFTNTDQDEIDVSGFDTSQATSLHGMFDAAHYVKGYEHFNTGNVTDMGYMFDAYGVEGHLESVDVSKYDVRKVNATPYPGGYPGGFHAMFGTMANIKSLNIGNWQPRIPLDGIFWGADKLHIQKLTVSPAENLANSELLGPDTSYGTDKAIFTGHWENANDQYVKPGDDNKKSYTTAQLMAMYNGKSVITGNQTYQWEPVVTPGNPITVHYVDRSGVTIQPDTQLLGALAATYHVTPVTITGYRFDKASEGSLTGIYTSEPQSVTLMYAVAVTTPDSGSSSSSDSSGSSSGGDHGQPEVIAKKDRAITAVKKIGLYETPDFSEQTREFYYAKKRRTKRPQFVITGVARSKRGLKRYLVRDVTPDSKRFGKTGYITAKQAFTVHTYYQHKPKRVLVIQGTNAYREKSLKHQLRHFRRGKILRFKKMVRYHLTTRLVLNDGTFVTGNKFKVLEK